MKSLIAFAVCACLGSAYAATGADVACSLAPSQSKAAAAAVSSMGGAGAATAAIGQALGLSVVAHSSGAAILTGSGGYVSGTLGAAAAGPAIITVGIVAVTGATALEIVCAPRNHPEHVAKIAEASSRVAARFREGVRDFKSASAPKIEATRLKAKVVSGDVFDYVFRRSNSSQARTEAGVATPPFVSR